MTSRRACIPSSIRSTSRAGTVRADRSMLLSSMLSACDRSERLDVGLDVAAPIAARNGVHHGKPSTVTSLALHHACRADLHVRCRKGGGADLLHDRVQR